MALTKTQRDVVETSALKAFMGRMERLSDGFLIQTDKGPVAAVYWGGTREGNDLEISVAEGRGLVRAASTGKGCRPSSFGLTRRARLIILAGSEGAVSSAGVQLSQSEALLHES